MLFQCEATFHLTWWWNEIKTFYFLLYLSASIFIYSFIHFIQRLWFVSVKNFHICCSSVTLKNEKTLIMRCSVSISHPVTFVSCLIVHSVDKGDPACRMQDADWNMSRNFLPMKALGMVIFNHILSRTSRPDSGLAIALTTSVMSLWMVRRFSSWTPDKQQQQVTISVMDGWMDATGADGYHSVGGASLSLRQCETPRQQGQ